MNRVLAALIIAFQCFTSFSQDGPKVVVFNQSEQDEVTNTVQNLFKISVLEPLSGDISLYYERVLGANISAEAGVGFTIDDYFGSILFEDEFSTVYDDRTPLIGHSFALGFRYYPFIAADEIYFAPEFKYRYYHSEQVVSPGTTAMQTNHEYKKMSNFRITVGYNYFFDDNVFIDFYGGVGLAMFKYGGYNSVYDSQTDMYTYQFSEVKRPRPWLTLGIKFGFGI